MILRLEKFTTTPPTKVRKTGKRRTKRGSALADLNMEAELTDLVGLRVAQILGCKFCLHEYATRLKASGETDRRLRLLKNWRAETAFSLREKAALNLAEAVTCNPMNAVPGMAIQAARVFFNEEEVLLFILNIVTINDWHYLNSFQNGNMTRRPPHE